MKLKGRLKLIADKVPLCITICDIGTDHAYIPVYLLLNDICKKAIATDVKKGPIIIAKKNISKYKLSERIETRVGNGLECIEKNESDVIVIAGMGGMLIRDILSYGKEKAKTAKNLILQPMNAVEVVRKWLHENGFDIYDEGLAVEGDKIYTVISSCWTGKVKEEERIYYYIGRKLVENNEPLLKRYIEKKLKQVGRILKGMEKSVSNNEDIEKYKWLYNELTSVMLTVNSGLSAEENFRSARRRRYEYPDI